MRGPIWAPTCVGDKRCDFKSCSFARAGCDREHPASGIDERDPARVRARLLGSWIDAWSDPQERVLYTERSRVYDDAGLGRCVMGRSLFERLGGNAAVTSVVEDFVVRCAGDS